MRFIRQNFRKIVVAAAIIFLGGFSVVVRAMEKEEETFVSKLFKDKKFLSCFTEGTFPELTEGEKKLFEEEIKRVEKAENEESECEILKKNLLKMIEWLKSMKEDNSNDIKMSSFGSYLESFCLTDLKGPGKILCNLFKDVVVGEQKNEKNAKAKKLLQKIWTNFFSKYAPQADNLLICTCNAIATLDNENPTLYLDMDPEMQRQYVAAVLESTLFSEGAKTLTNNIINGLADENEKIKKKYVSIVQAMSPWTVYKFSLLLKNVSDENKENILSILKAEQLTWVDDKDFINQWWYNRKDTKNRIEKLEAVFMRAGRKDKLIEQYCTADLIDKWDFSRGTRYPLRGATQTEAWVHRILGTISNICCGVLGLLAADTCRQQFIEKNPHFNAKKRGYVSLALAAGNGLVKWINKKYLSHHGGKPCSKANDNMYSIPSLFFGMVVGGSKEGNELFRPLLKLV